MRHAARSIPILLVLLSASAATAQQPETSLAGYTPERAARQRAVERDATARPSAAAARAHARALSREAHVAGTPAQQRTRDYVVEQMRRWGLETEVREYEVWMPHATEVRAWRVSPQPRELVLPEPPIPGRATSALPQYPTVNGYSGAGDVTAEVVYVNYGLVEDYAQLDSMGIPVRGRIAIARYGRSFRGIKAREAEKHGAVALIMYSDPQDDGYVRGDVYPEGPMRPPRGVQRGSVFNGVGDPATPGRPSLPGVARLPEAEVGAPRIPVIPMGYENAAELLRDVRGRDVPQAWQGGLPFRYHIGPGPVQARVLVRDDRRATPLKRIWNTFGTVRGSEFPDELVVLGAHRDAWSPGSVDNVSGTVSILEAARAVAEQLREGWRPRRTLVFATWDAEEWGLIGSVEHVEDDSLRLMRGGVAYLNQDAAASGTRFGAGGSPSLRSTLRSVAASVPDPNGTGSVYAQWRRNAGVADTLEPAMGDPGGGSDFAGFYNRLGIPHADWGFGGPGGIYHSHYDGPEWMEAFGDTAYDYHATAARIAAAMALRLANADVVPFDYVEFARTMQRHARGMQQDLQGGSSSADVGLLTAAVDRMERAALEFTTARDVRLAAVGALSPSVVRSVNEALRGVERALTRPEGLRTRPWYRGLIYVADENNGYSNMVFPTVNEAVRAGDAALIRREIADLAVRFDAAVQALQAARQALR